MSNKKQTSIDWLIEQLTIYRLDKAPEILQKTRAMHREEVRAAYNAGFDDGQDDANGDGAFYESGQNYYERIFEMK